MVKVRSSPSSLAPMLHAPANHDVSRVVNPPSPTAGVVRLATNCYVGNQNRMLTRSQARRERERRVAGALGALLNPAPPSLSSSSSPSLPPPPSPPQQQQQQSRLKVPRRRSGATVPKPQPVTPPRNSTGIKKSRAAEKVGASIVDSLEAGKKAMSKKESVAPVKKTKKNTNISKVCATQTPVPPKSAPASKPVSQRTADIIMQSRALIQASANARELRRARRSAVMESVDLIPATNAKAIVPSATLPPAALVQVSPPQSSQVSTPPHPNITIRRNRADHVVLPKSGRVNERGTKDDKTKAVRNERRSSDASPSADVTAIVSLPSAAPVPVLSPQLPQVSTPPQSNITIRRARAAKRLSADPVVLPKSESVDEKGRKGDRTKAVRIESRSKDATFFANETAIVPTATSPSAELVQVSPPQSLQVATPPHPNITIRRNRADHVVLPKSGRVNERGTKEDKTKAVRNERRSSDATPSADVTAIISLPPAPPVQVLPPPSSQVSTPIQSNITIRRTRAAKRLSADPVVLPKSGNVDEKGREGDKTKTRPVEKDDRSKKRRTSEPNPEPVSIDSSDSGSAQEVEAMEDLVETARNLPIPEDVEPAPSRNKVHFNRNVRIRWMNRLMGQNGPAPYYLTGEPQFESVQRLKRPESRKSPRKITAAEMIAIGDETNFEELPVMENPVQRRGCSDTCQPPARARRGRNDRQNWKGGCGADCSCRLEGIECSDYFGCPCNMTCCDQWNEELAQIQSDQARAEEVAAANQKTTAWSPRNESTLSSVGTFDADLQVTVRHSSSGESTGSLDISAIVEESDMPMEEDTPETQVQHQERDARPPLEVFDTDASMELDDELQGEEMMEEELEDGDYGKEEEEKEDSVRDDGSVSSSDDDIDYTANLPIDLKAENFSQNMLDMMLQMVGKDVEDNCKPKTWLSAEAVFVGLLKIATQHNRDYHNHGRHAAVLHPQVFYDALRVATAEAADVARRKMGRIRGPAPLHQLDEDTVTQLVAYGCGWTEMFIPINVDNRHWVIAVVQRSTVEVVVYDSQETSFKPKSSREVLVMEEKKKKHQETLKMRKAALRKILEALEKLNPEDTTTGRFRIRFARSIHSNLQTDGHSCGLFTLLHARRSLECRNSNLRLRKDEAAMNIPQERRNLGQSIKEIREALEAMQANNVRLVHDGNGMKNCTPGKALVKLRWCGKV